MCLHTSIYVFSYCYICVLILLHASIYVFSYCYVCVLILLLAAAVRSVLKLNPTANAKKTHALVLEEINGVQSRMLFVQVHLYYYTCVLVLLYMCSHATVDVQSRMLFVQVHLCSRTITTIHVSSYCYTCVLMLL